jgi:cytochrome c-type biogenesis protein
MAIDLALLWAVFSGGVLSFVSPCVLPLVPGYLSAVSGVGIADLERGRRWGVLGPALVFCLAFTTVFVALGMTATGLGSFLRDSRGTLDKIAGGLIIAMGLLFVATPFIPRLNREWRVDALMRRAGTGGPLVAGAAFAFAWTPCVGPTLGAVLSAAAVESTLNQGAFLLLAYSGGLAIPFLATAVAFTRATTAFRWLRNHYVAITACSGAILVVMGWLMFHGELTQLNIEIQRALEAVGLDALYEL